MIGPEAGEVMAVVEMAMLAGLPYTALRDAVLTHPTMAEGLNPLFSSVNQRREVIHPLTTAPVTRKRKISMSSKPEEMPIPGTSK
jgi:hypothetical protein